MLHQWNFIRVKQSNFTKTTPHPQKKFKHGGRARCAEPGSAFEKKKRFFSLILWSFQSFVSSFLNKNFFYFGNTCTFYIRSTTTFDYNMKIIMNIHLLCACLMCGLHLWLSTLSVNPVYEMLYKPSYLLEPNELDRLAYIQHLGLLMKWVTKSNVYLIIIWHSAILGQFDNEISVAY